MRNGNVLLTGASGFVGTHILIELLNAGYAVRGTLRNLDRGKDILKIIKPFVPKDFELEFVYADLLKDEGWGTVTKDCDYVHHVAAPISLDVPKDPDAFIPAAVDGTLRVLNAASKNNIKRVVATSTLGAVTYGEKINKEKVFNDGDWTDPNYKGINAYIRAKTLAEKAAWDYMKNIDSNMTLTTINPGLILGPILDPKDAGVSCEGIKQMFTGELPMYPRLGFSVVDVRDVAKCHMLAMENEKAEGHRFLCGVDFAWFSDLGAILREQYPDRKIPKMNMPNWMVHFFGIFNGGVRQLRDDLNRTQHVDIEKTTKILGWKPRSVKEATIATADSLIKLGIV
ncbi:MAG: nucleoside-diphosphate sugar epimerase [Candidatus Marinimicrobia bacterium]|nr:nucleoside-diphosphate sugar epimerase [Candidatus Neomarinimicrobiota bacterium]|tara:strand:+ start:3027 stop:4049 length:1023 start_codon:yes stop_codon:yes gene_type:complete